MTLPISFFSEYEYLANFLHAYDARASRDLRESHREK